MDSGMNEKINEIASMLGQDEVPPDVINIISKIAQNSGDSDGTDCGNSTDNDLEDNIALMAMIKRVMDRKKNSKHDPAMVLLSSLEPFLSDSRKEKLKKCMKVMNLTQMTDLLKDSDIF